MQVVILSGGSGARLNEENLLKPKPMVEIGGQPILWHIMKYFSHYGHNDFIICLGYKQYMVKEYFADFFLHTSDIEFNLSNNTMKVLNNNSEGWNVKLIDTGINTLPASRVKRVAKYLDDDFYLVYGDSLSNIDLNAEYSFHKSHGKVMTLAITRMINTKGVLDIDKNNVITSFREKSDTDASYINSGYMLCNKKILDYIDGDMCAFDRDVFPKLVKDNQLMSYKHNGFWRGFDKEYDIKALNDMWNKNMAEWKVWG